MKKSLSLVVTFFITVVVIAQPPKGPATRGMAFGARISSEAAFPISEIATKVSGEQETDVKVKGRVSEVCTQMGCWLKMQSADGKVMVKMKDHAFFVPVDLNGKEIIVDGTAKVSVTSVSELKHYAEDAGKTKEEIAAIKEPKKEIVLVAKGVLVL
jgi:hypothetical protein